MCCQSSLHRAEVSSRGDVPSVACLIEGDGEALIMRRPWATKCLAQWTKVPSTYTLQHTNYDLIMTTPFDCSLRTHHSLALPLLLPQPAVSLVTPKTTNKHNLIQSCTCELKHDALLLVYGPLRTATKVLHYLTATHSRTLLPDRISCF